MHEVISKIPCSNPGQCRSRPDAVPPHPETAPKASKFSSILYAKSERVGRGQPFP
jgi:hypothetical protein